MKLTVLMLLFKIIRFVILVIVIVIVIVIRMGLRDHGNGRPGNPGIKIWPRAGGGGGANLCPVQGPILFSRGGLGPIFLNHF